MAWIGAALRKLTGRPSKDFVFASALHVEEERPQIKAFLIRVLPEDEREFIETYFISDEATIFDCSLADLEVLRANCEAAYGIKLSKEKLHWPLWELVRYVHTLKV